MCSFAKNIYSVESVREMDRLAIHELGIPGYELMQRAAKAAFEAARENFPDTGQWQLICGGGNNGGDGYVVARLAREAGIDVTVLSLVDPARLKDDAATAYVDFVAAGGQSAPWRGALEDDAEVLVDAILGSGLQRAVSGEFAAAVAAINDHAAPVLALDIASGLHADSGEVLGDAVNASLTTTFVALKAGLFLGAGPQHTGKLVFDGLGIDDAARRQQTPLYRQIGAVDIATALPPRDRNAHKGDFGHVLVVGGGPGMPGAAQLCGEAALRAGAGRVSVATHPDHAAAISAARPELMTHGVSSAAELEQRLETADVVAFGPGLGQSDWAKALYAAVSEDARPAVWDADALNLLASDPGVMGHRIITPHPGEAAKLLGVATGEVQADRPASLAMLATRYGGIAVLKGAGTLTSSNNGAPYLCTAGNPGMAAPGMGDALTGVIAALLAQGLAHTKAAAFGVELHARAGDFAAEDGERGTLTSDLIRALPQVLNP